MLEFPWTRNSLLYCIWMFIFSHFHALVTVAGKAFMPQHSNKNIRVQVHQSQDRIVIHTDAYVSVYAHRVSGSNMKIPWNRENILLNTLQLLISSKYLCMLAGALEFWINGYGKDTPGWRSNRKQIYTYPLFYHPAFVICMLSLKIRGIWT